MVHTDEYGHYLDGVKWSHGAYEILRSPGERADCLFRLKKVDGEWRLVRVTPVVVFKEVGDDT